MRPRIGMVRVKVVYVEELAQALMERYKVRVEASLGWRVHKPA